jgi:hypothetical protein
MAFAFNPFTGKLDFTGTGGGGGGGAFGAIYYFNRSNASSISGYYEMSKNLVIGAGTTLTATGAGTQLVGSFATVLNNPNVTTIPSGNWNFENYVSMNSNGGTPEIYGEIYSRNLAGTETLIATNISNPHTITDGTVNELYLWSIPVPATNILATDRIVVKFYALNLGGRTMTMHFEDANVAQVTTSLPSVDLSAYVLKSGDTMAGKLVAAADDTASKLNIGNAITGTSPTTTTNGDVWITSGNRLAYRSNSTVYNTAQTNLQNTFNQPQAVDVSSATTALRVTQRGAGEALRVEDETSPDSTAFVISNLGRVGVGVTPDATVALSVDTSGIKFGNGTIQTTAYIASQVYQSTYYKTTQQNLVSGSTDITFDADGSWNNSNGYITHTAGSADFVVVQTGLYQLDFNISVTANGATWNVGTNKVASIDITRSPEAEQATIAQTAVVSTTTDYIQSVSSSFYLVAGDIINLRAQGNYATAIPFARPLTNTFDLNTWFSWRFIS